LPITRAGALEEDTLMFPRYWTITIDGRTVTVVASTRAAAEAIAARLVAKEKRL
jgi:hypothetical protein